MKIREFIIEENPLTAFATGFKQGKTNSYDPLAGVDKSALKDIFTKILGGRSLDTDQLTLVKELHTKLSKTF
jgi:hypothetical protein